MSHSPFLLWFVRREGGGLGFPQQEGLAESLVCQAGCLHSSSFRNVCRKISSLVGGRSVAQGRSSPEGLVGELREGRGPGLGSGQGREATLLSVSAGASVARWLVALLRVVRGEGEREREVEPRTGRAVHFFLHLVFHSGVLREPPASWPSC